MHTANKAEISGRHIPDTVASPDGYLSAKIFLTHDTSLDSIVSKFSFINADTRHY